MRTETPTSKTTKILFYDSFVNSGSTTNTLTVVVSNTSKDVEKQFFVDMKNNLRAPPVSLALDIS